MYGVRRFTIRKISGQWELYFEHRGKRIRRALGDKDRKAAIESARLHVQAVMEGNAEAARLLMQRPGQAQLSKMGELFEKLEQLPGPASLPNYALSLKAVLRCVFPGRPVAELSTVVLTEETGRKYFAECQAEAKKAGDQCRQQQLLRSARSTFNQAKALFGHRLLEGLKAAGVALPDVSGFRLAFKKYAAKGGTAGSVEIPGEDILRRTLIKWARMGEDPTKRNEFLAMGLELACGLRKAEVSQAKWEWLTERLGTPVVVTTDAWVKNQSGGLEVVPLEPFWGIMQRAIERHGWRGQPEDYILTGHLTERGDWVFERVGKILRGLGWQTQKTNHALRDYGASLITMKYGLDFAKRWCRHRSITTTEKHYSRFVDPVLAIQRKKRLKWVRFAGESFA